MLRPFELIQAFKLVAEYFFFRLFSLGFRSRRSNGGQRNEATFRLGLFQDVLAVEFLHARILAGLLQLFIAGAQLLFTRGLGDAQLVESSVASGMSMVFIHEQFVVAVRHSHFLATGKDLVTAMLLVPFG